MTTLLAILVAVGGLWALAYIGAPLLVTSAAIGAYIVALYGLGLMGPTAFAVTGGLFAVLAVVLNLRPVRRLVTKPIFAGFKAVLPPMTSTEREALEAGDVWWEGEMFRGRPDWNMLKSFKRTQLTAEEQAFLDNETVELCRMIDDYKTVYEDRDLAPEVWDFMRQKKFFSMLITKEWGGLGFSAYAQSCVVTKIATKSITAAVTVMVPNSLGPGELLTHYGTDAQKEQWLPKLADGTEIPCFGLTGVEVGSDATAIPDVGVVCKGEWEGQEVVGMRLTFNKRYITLAPVASVIGLAFKLQDPDGLLGDPEKTDYGITCALIPASTPGVEIGRRHYPSGAFMNGPITGEDVFVPIDWIIGGVEKAGGGWRMLVECLSAGRGISLPALSAAGGKMAYRLTGAYSRIRRQFKLSVGKFEGVQEATGRIAGLNYRLEAVRTLTASAVDNCAPSVVTAIAKYHMTEMMRQSLTDAMDVHGGRGIMVGPRNYLSSAYQSVPVAITVEGANILTRSLMIFGQGAIRCHPYVFPEMEAAREDNLAEFDKLLWGHIGFSMNRGVRALTLGLTGGALAKAPVDGPTAKYYKQLERMSTSLAFVSDVTMGILGGELKRKERLSARLGDVLSHLYMASAVLKYYEDEGRPEEDLPHVRWCLDDSLNTIYEAFDEFFSNFPVGFVGAAMRRMVFPFGRSYRPVSDALTGTIADMMMEPTELRDRLSEICYLPKDANDPVGLMEVAFDKLIQVEPLYNKYYKALSKGELTAMSLEERLAQAVDQGVLTQAEADQVGEYDRLRYEAIMTDAFTKEYLAGTAFHPDVEVDGQSDEQPAKVA